MIVGVVVASAATAQNSAVVGASPAAPVNAPGPQLPYGVSQILQLSQAKLGEDTIVSYIRNSGNSYGLNADQIIYLRQQGLSDGVIRAMLTQPRAGVAVAAPATPAPQPMAPAYAGQAYAGQAYAGQASTVTVAPPVTYVQTVPAAPYYYYDPNYYYYPGYAWYPPVTIGWGWGGWGWGWGGGWYGGGYRGGWHGGYGGGWHGGGYGVGGHGFAHGGGFGGGGHGGGGHGGGHR